MGGAAIDFYTRTYTQPHLLRINYQIRSLRSQGSLLFWLDHQLCVSIMSVELLSVTPSPSRDQDVFGKELRLTGEWLAVAS